MNKIIQIVVWALILSSCSFTKEMTIRVSSSHDATETQKGNFVKLKNGNEISLLNSVSIDHGMPDVNRLTKLTIGNKSFKGKDVASFQIEKKYYENLNIRKKNSNEFGVRIYKGPINIFTHTEVSQSVEYNSNGSSVRNYKTTTRTVSLYYLQSPNINNGAFTQVLNTNKVDKMMPYLNDYKPSLSILNKYNDVRKKARKTKLMVSGAIVFSAAALIASGNQTLEGVGAGIITTGILFIPPFCIFHKINNKTLPYRALQKYIDNNFSKTNTSFLEKQLSANSKVIASDSIVGKMSLNEIVDTSKLDFLIMKSGSKIIAEPGTILETSNNQAFKINNQIITNPVSAFQQNGLFYKKINAVKDFNEFACRYIKGKISIYENTLDVAHSIKKPRNFFITSDNDKKSVDIESIHNKIFKQSFFEKNNNNELIPNTNKLKSFFSDNITASKMYSNYQKNIIKSKVEAYGLFALSLFGYYASVKSFVNEKYVLGSTLGIAASLNLMYIVPSISTKIRNNLNKELLNTVEYYNTH